jgi:hypothetical protein
MGIPESQLETWSKQGSVTGSSTTYNHIKGTLESSSTPFANKSFWVFLQGSYGNDTNIYAESDVDVVIRLDSTFHKDVSSLSVGEQMAFNLAFSDSVYQYSDFKRDVLSVLTDTYGDEVKAGGKAIMVPAGNNRRKADVIVAMQYRRYIKFNGTQDQDYVEGIIFFTSSGAEIVNYPKQHSSNLTSKHQGTSKWLKPTVRVFKNLRSKLVEKGKIQAGIAPSYYVEGLLYNVPSEKFGSSYDNCFCNAVNWLQQTDKTKLVCANEQYYLLRSGFHTCWEPANCDKFLQEAIDLWNNW